MTARTWFGKGEDYAIVRDGGLVFRDASPADIIAPTSDAERAAAVEWLCPALATGHAGRLATAGALAAPSASDFRAFVLGNYEATRRPS